MIKTQKQKEKKHKKDTRKSSLQPGLSNFCCMEQESIALVIHHLSPMSSGVSLVELFFDKEVEELFWKRINCENLNQKREKCV